jgi:hypothetical protein
MKATSLLAVILSLLLIGCGKDHELGREASSTPLYFKDGAGVPLKDVEIFNELVEKGVPAKGLKQALLYLQENSEHVSNHKFLTLIDFTQHSKKARMYVIDLVTNEFEQLHVAHGRGTDPGHTGWAKYFSNTHNSKKSSLGIYLTAERYYGKNGLSLRLDGKQPSNSNARARAIVVHGASYVSPGRSVQGRSYGCPAVTKKKIRSVVEKIEDGSIFYAFKNEEDPG